MSEHITPIRRTSRGSSWSDLDYHLHLVDPNSDYEDFRYCEIGFRIVQEGKKMKLAKIRELLSKIREIDVLLDEVERER